MKQPVEFTRVSDEHDPLVMGRVVFDAACVVSIEAYWNADAEIADNRYTMVHFVAKTVNFDNSRVGVKGSVKQVLAKLKKAWATGQPKRPAFAPAFRYERLALRKATVRRDHVELDLFRDGHASGFNVDMAVWRNRCEWTGLTTHGVIPAGTAAVLEYVGVNEVRLHSLELAKLAQAAEP